nr:copia protein [Tanacetum cinerariifolium]
MACKSCDELKLENAKLKETQVKFVKFDKSANSLREMLNNQNSPSCKIGLGFNSDKGSTSRAKTMSFVGSSAKKVTDGSTIKGHGSTLHGSVCLRTCLEPNEWIKDSGCSKHMTSNKSLFSAYKAYDGDGSEIIKDGKIIENRIRKNRIVSKNKARLVAQGYNQQEAIDYDVTYAPVARLESIRILLAIACENDFKLYQMDVKSAFLNGFINEEVYVAQPPRFIDFQKPNYVYKLKKALYGLKQALKACFDWKIPNQPRLQCQWRLSSPRTMKSTLWIARPDIMFSVYLCARFQENPKNTHLEVVKPIFRYIRGTSHLGLWYLKKTGIETVVYADSDHASDYADRKKTIGICKFMGCCLTSWFAKKKMALATCTMKAEYVSIEKACQQALWMKQALIDYGIWLDNVPIMCDNKGAINLGTKMPSKYKQDYKKTRSYTLKLYNDPNMSDSLRDIYRALESRYIYEGRTIDPSFYNDLSDESMAKFTAIGFNCLISLNEQICPRALKDDPNMSKEQRETRGMFKNMGRALHNFESTKMPSEYQQDYKKTRSYAPKLYNDPNISDSLKDIYRALESIYVMKGEPLTHSSIMTLVAKFTAIGFNCLLSLDEQICPRTVHEKIDKDRNIIYKLPNQIETSELFDDLRSCELVIRESVYSATGNRYHTQAVIALMLYCLENRLPFNLAYFIFRRMYFSRDRRDKVLPYGMILTRLFENHKENMGQGSFDERYKLVPRKMSSLKAKQPKRPPPKRTRNVGKSKRTQLTTSSLTESLPSDNGDLPSTKLLPSSYHRTLKDDPNISKEQRETRGMFKNLGRALHNFARMLKKGCR